MSEGEEHRLPKVGEKWTFDEGYTASYWVTFVDEEFVHLTDAEEGTEVSPYSLHSWRRAYQRGAWKFSERAEDSFCPMCEERLKAEDDYLCEECRYGG